MGNADFDHAETTTKIYKVDVAKLKQVQRELSAARREWVTLPELLHEVITPERLQQLLAQEAGKP